MQVDPDPFYALGRIDRQASLNKVSALIRNLYLFVIRTQHFDLLQHLLVTRGSVWILPVDHLVVYHTDRPKVSLYAIRFSLEHLRRHGHCSPEHRCG